MSHAPAEPEMQTFPSVQHDVSLPRPVPDSTIHSDYVSGYSPAVQASFTAETPHVHWRSPLVQEQDEITPDVSTQDVSFGEMLGSSGRTGQQTSAQPRTFPTTPHPGSHTAGNPLHPST